MCARTNHLGPRRPVTLTKYANVSPTMCKCIGKTLFYPLNFVIAVVGLALIAIGGHTYVSTRELGVFAISTFSVGVVLLFNSILICSKGFKNSCLVGIYLFFLATLMIAEVGIASCYFIPKFQSIILHEIPEDLKKEVKENLLIARWVLLGLVGVQAVAFLVGLALCRGIKPKDSRRGDEERLMSAYEGNYTMAVKIRRKDFRYTCLQDEIPIASSWAKHAHLYQSTTFNTKLRHIRLNVVRHFPVFCFARVYYFFGSNLKQKTYC